MPQMSTLLWSLSGALLVLIILVLLATCWFSGSGKIN